MCHIFCLDIAMVILPIDLLDKNAIRRCPIVNHLEGWLSNVEFLELYKIIELSGFIEPVQHVGVRFHRPAAVDCDPGEAERHCRENKGQEFGGEGAPLH